MYLGVDGGGTKTAYALIDDRGRILASHLTASVSHLSVGLTAATAMLGEGIRAILAQASLQPADIAFAFFGLPAYGEDSATTTQMDAMPTPILERAKVRCGNDMICSWAGSLGCRDGISVIAGTGSIAYGEYAGRAARTGGWGELIGDEGSAYWIAREGMNLFSRMSDGRAARGPLHAIVCKRFDLGVDLDLCARLYGESASARSTFAQFAKLVSDAATAGDHQARELFLRAADELVALALAVRRTLAVPDTETLPVSYSGGALAGSPVLLAAFTETLKAIAPPFDCRAPLFPPVLGAALYAARLAGKPLAEQALATLGRESAKASLPQ
ncbi:MAG: N-acetylglucosamine kinase [Steroidobacteraceae bacterium]